MREFFTIAIFKIKADIRMNKTTLNSQKEKHSMLSLRRATFRRQRARRGPQHFYPRSPCGERQLAIYNQLLIQNISIHALLAESDVAGLIFRAKFVIFLSTLSLRRATSAPAIKSCWSSYFYPRSPCGERPKSANTLPAVTLFLSTLSLRRATYTAICLAPPILFLSTLSLRRATGRGPHSPLVWQISIHALLAESDL